MNIQLLTEAYKEIANAINQCNLSLFNFQNAYFSACPNKRTRHLTVHFTKKQVRKKIKNTLKVFLGKE